MDNTCFRQRVALSMTNNSSTFTQPDYLSRIFYFRTTIKMGHFSISSKHFRCIGLDCLKTCARVPIHILSDYGLNLGIKLNMNKYSHNQLVMDHTNSYGIILMTHNPY